MTKSMGLVCLGGLLIMAVMPVIICTAPKLHPFSVICSIGNCIGDSVQGVMDNIEKERMITNIKKKRPIERTTFEWQELVDSYISDLEAQRSRIFPEEAQKVIEMIISARQYQPNLSLHKLSTESRRLLLLWQASVGCASDFVEDFSLAMANRQQHRFVVHSLRNYLNKCGHEDNFTKATKTNLPGHWNSGKFPTLISYIVKPRFLIPSKWNKRIKNVPERLSPLLSTIETLAKYKSIMDEPDCKETEYRDELVNSLKVKINYPDLYELVKDYIGLYLHKCGYEKRFERAMIRHKFPIDQGKSPLASYLWGDYSRRLELYNIKEADGIIFLLKFVSYLRYPDGIDEFNCSRQTMFDIYSMHSKSKGFDLIVKPLEDVFPDYFRVCISDFIALARQFEREHSDSLAFIAKLAKLVTPKLRASELPSRVTLIRYTYETIEDIEKGQLNVPELASETSDIRNRYFKESKLLWEHMEPNFRALAYHILPITVGKEIREFMDYIGICHQRYVSDLDTEIIDMLDEFAKNYTASVLTFQPPKREWLTWV